jgi:hypothetical protein
MSNKEKFVIVNINTNKIRTDYLGRPRFYADERSANAALLYMNPRDRKNHFVDMYFDESRMDLKSLLKTYKEQINENDIVNFSSYAGMYSDGAHAYFTGKDGKMHKIAASGDRPRKYYIDGKEVSWDEAKRQVGKQKIKSKQGMNEDTDLSEKVEIDHSRYMRSHKSLGLDESLSESKFKMGDTVVDTKGNGEFVVTDVISGPASKKVMYRLAKADGAQSPNVWPESRLRLKKRVAEDLGLSERVEVDHSRYMRSHGKKARDPGYAMNWMFTSKEMGKPKSDEMVTVSGKLSAAAKEAAKKLGTNRVYVMEEVELTEKTMIDIKAEVESLLGKKLDGKMLAKFRTLRKVGYANPYDIVNQLKEEVELSKVDSDWKWTYIKESLDKDYAGMLGKFKKAVDKAEEAKSRGDKEKMSRYLEDARNRLFGMKSTDSSKLKNTDHYDRYNKMKGLKESLDEVSIIRDDRKFSNVEWFETDKQANDFLEKNPGYGVLHADKEGIYVAKNTNKGKLVKK